MAGLEQAIEEILRGYGLHLSVTVDIGPDALPDIPSVVLFFGSTDAKADAQCRAAAEGALTVGRVVIPVVTEEADFGNEIPDPLRPFNAHFWSPQGADGLARVVLEELGIEDRQRRVFISHRRTDGLLMAEQLHDELSHCRFKPFVDRFAIAPGEDVQTTIADALEGFAFLLLLESPDASDSEWVFYEVQYALSHYMGLCIVTFPGAPEVPATQGLPRVQLVHSDLVADRDFMVLIPEALQRVVSEVEKSHAQGLVRRRQNIVLSVQEAIMAAGKEVVPLRGWRLLIDESPQEVVGVAARLPDVSDLYQLDQAAASIAGGQHRTVLVHAARILGDQRKGVLEWAVGERDMTLIPENAVGAYW